MCGIAGFVDDSGDGEKTLSAMLKAIAHRGPDASKIFISQNVHLGHNRLSIIDLSSDADQPMHDSGLTIVYNGEIYNYIELRTELERNGEIFKTKSDTEVILKAYQQWGEKCVEHFVGMWAFALWDKNENKLFCSRDRFGIKPFYYINNNNKFYFGSEYKALKPTPVFSNEINQYQVLRGLQMGWICYEDETYFDVIKALPAAHNLVYYRDKAEIKIYRYWSLQTGIYSNLSFDEKCATFYELFSQSVKLHYRSDVPVASCLSGGLDSSAIVSMVQEQHPGMTYKTFSIYYEGKGDVDERPFVNEVLKKYPSLKPYYFSPSDSQVTEHFHHALYHADVPSTGSSFISQYFLMKLIKEQGIKVVLDGQGADEYLAGYKHTFYRMVADVLSSGQVSQALALTGIVSKNQALSSKQQFAHLGKSLLSVAKSEQKLYSLEYLKYYPFMGKDKHVPFWLDKVDGNRTDNFLYHLLFTTSLPSLLQYEDRNSMAFSIESRVPFLDHRLVEFSFGLRNEEKANGIYTKWIMRSALQHVLPPKIAWRKDKKGFVTPGEVKWLRGPLTHLTESDFSKLDFLNQNKIKRIIANYKRGDNSHALLVWRLCTLAYWQKYFC